MQRRELLKLGITLGGGVLALGHGAVAASRSPTAASSGSVPLRIANRVVELAPRVTVMASAIEGNFGASPPTALEVHNATGVAQWCTCPGLSGALIVPPGACVRGDFDSPRPGAWGGSWQHFRAHGVATAAGVVRSADATFVTGTRRGDYDQEQVLAVHHWPAGAERERDHLSFNDTLLSASDPIRVRSGDRVLFHFANTGVSRGVTLSLAQHRFLIVALDGFAVPTPRSVNKVFLGAGENVDALVEMNRPGRWLLGSSHRGDRAAGIGRLVEYADATGTAIQDDYGAAVWDYDLFGAAGRDGAHRPAMTAAAAVTIRGTSRPGASSEATLPVSSVVPLRYSADQRQRLTLTNATREPRSLHFLEHSVELVGVAGRATSGIRKDVVTVPSYTRLEVALLQHSREVLVAHSPDLALQTTAL